MFWDFSRILKTDRKGALKPPPPIITKLYSVKKGHIFKTSTQKKINTVHNIISFSMVFTNKNRGGDTFRPPPPPIITKVYLPPIITKVKSVSVVSQRISSVKSFKARFSLISKIYH